MVTNRIAPHKREECFDGGEARRDAALAVRRRLESLLSLPRELTKQGIPFSTALRRTLASGYGLKEVRADLMAGLVVGVVALPLSMALAIAVGAPPQHGLYTAVVAGAAIALTGGSKFQIAGPTAAFIVILEPIVRQFGLSGLLTAGLMAGVLLVLMGVARLGRLIQFIPHPVTTGFTSGIAVVIATLQIKDAFGLQVPEMPEGYVGKVMALWGARGTASLAEASIAALTLGLLLGVPKVIKRIPAPLIALAVSAGVAFALSRFFPGFHVVTIGTKFHTTVGDTIYAGIPPLPPRPILPWGQGHFTFAMAKDLFPAAFTIAMLGAIESLLSAVIADGMTGKRHDPNAELVGQGIGNILAPFFGGIAATGALARTATNIRAGAKSPFSAVFHSAVVLLSIMVLAPLVAYVPMASLAGLLLLVAWNMSERRHFAHILQVAPKSDVTVLLTCFFLTVFFDMVKAVSVGVVLAALLFMKRMAELTQGRLGLSEGGSDTDRDLPEGVVRYEIAGPLFFGAAQHAMGQIDRLRPDVRVIILDLSRVPAIDATGLVALESACASLYKGKRRVIISGPLPEPRRVFDKAELSRAYLTGDLDEAKKLARELMTVAGTDDAPPSRSQIAPTAPPA
jgi:sulfate permease, SulP family